MNSAFWLLAVPLMFVWHFAGEQRCLNSELWHACAGPLVSLPMVGSRVVYFPQGHSEQVGHLVCAAVSWNKLGMAEFVDFRFCKQVIKRITCVGTFLVLLIMYQMDWLNKIPMKVPRKTILPNYIYKYIIIQIINFFKIVSLWSCFISKFSSVQVDDIIISIINFFFLGLSPFEVF